MTEITIRPVAVDDRARWEPLWLGYVAFYEKRVPQATTDYTWQRILDPANPIEALLAIDEQNNALGLVQYLLHESTWNTGGNVYLQDLFVVPEARGLRIGRRLIEAVAEISRKKGAGVLYWQTEEFNGTARRLYERLAKRAPFVRYNIEL
jgi:GNAT superfamily N-acetyltransferase